jgi:hypothetical protein
VILAVNALQVAVGKEYIADAFITGNSRFFTLVCKNGRNSERGISLAIAQFPGEPVGVAISRANPASPEFFQIF